MVSDVVSEVVSGVVSGVSYQDGTSRGGTGHGQEGEADESLR